MIENPSTGDNSNIPRDRLPPVGKGVLVRHDGQKLMAYLDGQGKWRNYDTGDILQGPVILLQIDRDS
jgi:hypothetical protein